MGSAAVLMTSVWGPIKRSPGALAYTVNKAVAAAPVETLAAELLERAFGSTAGRSAPCLGRLKARSWGRPLHLLNMRPTWCYGCLQTRQGG